MKINQLTTKDIKSISAANRGMNAEDAINDTNEYYRLIDKAVIYKKPTPVQIVHVNYPSRNKAVITEAYYRTPSTTDYNGVYKGYYIDFEVKETANKNTYPLSNIKEHQYKHLLQIEKHKGIPFIIIKWAYYDEYYLMTLDFLKENMSINKSISYDTIKEKCYKIDNSFYNRIDYLKIVDILIKKCS